MTSCALGGSQLSTVGALRLRRLCSILDLPVCNPAPPAPARACRWVPRPPRWPEPATSPLPCSPTPRPAWRSRWVSLCEEKKGFSLLGGDLAAVHHRGHAVLPACSGGSAAGQLGLRGVKCEHSWLGRGPAATAQCLLGLSQALPPARPRWCCERHGPGQGLCRCLHRGRRHSGAGAACAQAGRSGQPATPAGCVHACAPSQYAKQCTQLLLLFRGK